MNRSTLSIAAVVLVAGMAASHDASAVVRFDLTNGTGSCQGALPNFEGNLRKRPTAISNEGTANAFVSCSIQQDFIGTPAIAYGLLVNNNSAAVASVTCTFVAGVKANGALTPTLFPKTFEVPAGGVAEVQWSAEDNGDEPLPNIGNWSCNIPVGTEIASTYVIADDEPPAP